MKAWSLEASWWERGGAFGSSARYAESIRSLSSICTLAPTLFGHPRVTWCVNLNRNVCYVVLYRRNPLFSVVLYIVSGNCRSVRLPERGGRRNDGGDRCLPIVAKPKPCVAGAAALLAPHARLSFGTCIAVDIVKMMAGAGEKM